MEEEKSIDRCTFQVKPNKQEYLKKKKKVNPFPRIFSPTKRSKKEIIIQKKWKELTDLDFISEPDSFSTGTTSDWRAFKLKLIAAFFQLGFPPKLILEVENPQYSFRLQKPSSLNAKSDFPILAWELPITETSITKISKNRIFFFSQSKWKTPTSQKIT